MDNPMIESILIPGVCVDPSTSTNECVVGGGMNHVIWNADARVALLR